MLASTMLTHWQAKLYLYKPNLHHVRERSPNRDQSTLPTVSRILIPPGSFRITQTAGSLIMLGRKTRQKASTTCPVSSKHQCHKTWHFPPGSFAVESVFHFLLHYILVIPSHSQFSSVRKLYRSWETPSFIALISVGNQVKILKLQSNKLLTHRDVFRMETTKC